MIWLSESWGRCCVPWWFCYARYACNTNASELMNMKVFQKRQLYLTVLPEVLVFGLYFEILLCSSQREASTRTNVILESNSIKQCVNRYVAAFKAPLYETLDYFQVIFDGKSSTNYKKIPQKWKKEASRYLHLCKHGPGTYIFNSHYAFPKDILRSPLFNGRCLLFWFKVVVRFSLII